MEELVAAFLGHLVAPHHEKVMNGKPYVVSGRPVVFAGASAREDLAVTRLKKAYALAGFDKVDLAYEPHGAAYWYARNLARDETVLVADFGGGTSDFSVLRFEREAGRLNSTSLAHGGCGIAGDTFDYRLVDHLVAPRLGKGTLYKSFGKRLPLPAYFHAAFAQWHQLSFLKTPETFAQLHKLKAASEAPERLQALIDVIEQDLGFELYQAISLLKASLSDQDAAVFSFDAGGVKIEAQVTRAQFERWIAPDLAGIAAAMDATLARAGLAAESIDAVFLTGGTSFVPALRQLFSRRFGAERIHIGNAFQSVACGLALLAADRARG